MDELERLLDYDGVRYWLKSGWSVFFRVWQRDASSERPLGVKYSMTLHDELGERVLGFDNAHPIKGGPPSDHRHLCRKTEKLVRYKFVDADTLISDFFAAVEHACDQAGIGYEFELAEYDWGLEVGHEE